MFGPKGAEIGTYTTTFVYQGPFKKDSSTGSPVINEVVLGTSVNKRSALRCLFVGDRGGGREVDVLLPL